MRWLLPPVLWAALLAAMGAAAALCPGRAIGPDWLPWSGAALIGIGLGFLVTGRLAFRRVETTINTFDPPKTLVASGVFAITRNPMYLGFLLTLIGAALVLREGLALLGPLLFWAAAQFWYIPHEERMAEAGFGSEYSAYRARVRRWI